MKRLRVALAALISIAACSGLAACSGDEKDVGAGTSGRAPVTITHQYGSTTINGIPQRVVTIGSSWSDALIRLDVPIMTEFVAQGYSGKNNRFEWTPAHHSEVIEVPMSAGGAPPGEQIAKLHPDVILAGYLPSKAVYDTYSALAPTVPVMAKGAVVDDWQDVTNTAGEIFGKQDEAEKAVAEVNQQIMLVKDKYPGVAGKTFAFGQLTLDKQFGVVTSPTDPSSKLLGQIGLQIVPGVRSLSSDGSRAVVSPERSDLLNADLLVFWPLSGGSEVFNTIPGWSGLRAVRSGATVFLDNDNASAFSSPSVYSVPWALKKLEPALKKMVA